MHLYTVYMTVGHCWISEAHCAVDQHLILVFQPQQVVIAVNVNSKPSVSYRNWLALL